MDAGGGGGESGSGGASGASVVIGRQSGVSGKVVWHLFHPGTLSFLIDHLFFLTNLAACDLKVCEISL